MTEKNQPEQKKINIKINKEIGNGSYNNIVLSSFTKEEFIFDFAFLQPNSHQADIQSRIIMSPRNAKTLSNILSSHIAEYEKKFGPLDDPKGQSKIKFSYN
tara:strand:- start:3802 stop:4104 length:303 start_codon:yes stop_codon:yes gene_type:complete